MNKNEKEVITFLIQQLQNAFIISFADGKWALEVLHKKKPKRQGKGAQKP